MENKFSSLVKYLSLVILQRQKFTHADDCNIPICYVWNVLNEITCFSFYVTGFYCPVLLQYCDVSRFICSVIVYLTV